MRLTMILGLALAMAASAFAQAPDDDAKVRAVIAEWYQRVAATPADAPWTLFAPGAIDGGPGYAVAADWDRSSAVLRGPRLNHELAARALVFAYDIDELVVEDRLAKAQVWERGYFYAGATQTTYENAASTLFVFERQPDGQWKILAHEARSVGIPPNKATDPMPDLRELYDARIGAGGQPAPERE